MNIDDRPQSSGPVHTFCNNFQWP